MYEKIKQEMIEAALEMKRNNLITLAGGNVSCRMENGDMIVTPLRHVLRDYETRAYDRF